MAQAADAPAEPTPEAVPDPENGTAAIIAACDAKLEKYRAALEAGVDRPRNLGGWIATVKAERAAALAKAPAARTNASPNRRLTDQDIKMMVQALGDIREVIRNASAEDKARVYDELGLQLTYNPAKKEVRAEISLDPQVHGVMVSVRGGCEPITPRNPWSMIADLSLPRCARPAESLLRV